MATYRAGAGIRTTASAASFCSCAILPTSATINLLREVYGYPSECAPRTAPRERCSFTAPNAPAQHMIARLGLGDLCRAANSFPRFVGPVHRCASHRVTSLSEHRFQQLEAVRAERRPLCRRARPVPNTSSAPAPRTQQPGRGSCTSTRRSDESASHRNTSPRPAEEHNGNISGAARALRIEPHAFQRRAPQAPR